MVQAFIFDNYERFAESDLTFRHLKTHVAERTRYTYQQLGVDELAEVIESTTDAIANECNMGELPLQVCKQRIGYRETHLDEL